MPATAWSSRRDSRIAAERDAYEDQPPPLPTVAAAGTQQRHALSERTGVDVA